MKYIDVYTYRKNFKKSSNRWHNANKVLPKCENGSQPFLTVFHGESGFMDVAYFDGKDWHKGGTDGERGVLLTHWRELPDWPKIRIKNGIM